MPYKPRELPKIIKCAFVPQWVAEQIEPHRHIAMISLRQPGDDVPLKNWNTILRIECDDVWDPTEGKIFNEGHARDVIEFLEPLSMFSPVYQVIVHCKAGVSRSAAVARFIHDYYVNVRYPLVGCDRNNQPIYDKLVVEYFRRYER